MKTGRSAHTSASLKQMKRKKYCLSLVLVCWLAQLSVSASVAQTARIKIGVSTALTGGAANNGQDIRDVVLYAGDKIAHGKYELLFEDDKCSGKEAVSVAHKFAHFDKVAAVIGFACSGAALAAAPIYEQAQIPVIVTCGSAPGIAKSGKYIFRTTADDAQSAKTLYAYAQSRHKTLGILSEETEYAQRMRSGFAEANAVNKLRLVMESYPPGTYDFKSIFVRMRAANPDGLFLNPQSEDSLGVMVKQLGELNWSLPLYGAYWPASPSFLDAVKEKANGIIFVDTPALDHILTKEGKTIFADYTKKYGQMRSTESVFATTYEAFRVIHEAIESGKDKKDYLERTIFQGVFGPYRFDEDGEIEGLSISLKEIIDGKVVTIQ
jgi:branched-chain amino acid transport system substrate-binding protein